jgi:hypothetical protein
MRHGHCFNSKPVQPVFFIYSVPALLPGRFFCVAAKERQRLAGIDKKSENETRTKLADIAGVSHDTIQKVQKIQAAARHTFFFVFV